MKTYSKIMMHVQRHRYIKGRYKDEAPMEPSQRWKSKFRCGYDEHTGEAWVTYHSTRILRARRDSPVLTIDFNGWNTSTTRGYFAQALRSLGLFYGWPFAVHNRRVMGISQPVINKVLFYDGIQVDERTWDIVSPLREFKAKRLNREAAAEVRSRLAASGFDAVFPIMYAAAEEKLWLRVRWPRYQDFQMFLDNNRGDEWGALISQIKSANGIQSHEKARQYILTNLYKRCNIYDEVSSGKTMIEY